MYTFRMFVPVVCLLLAVTIGVHGQDIEVAFSVGLTHHQAVSGGQQVIYDHVFTNVGSAYSSDTGKFTCPQNGLYVFQVHSLARNNSDMWLELRHNFEYVMSVWGHTDNDFAAAGNSAVVQLNKGDEMSVISTDGYDSELFGSPDQIYCTFSGYLISPAFSNFETIG